MQDNITLNPLLQEKLLSGISKVSAVIRQSYGPKGSNVSVEDNLYPYHKVVNDAESIIQAIHLEDPIERRGLNFVKELSSKASKDSGEGRKTTIIIAEELLKGGFEAKIPGMRLKEELDALLPDVLDSLDKQSQQITLEDIHKVAETSSRSKETAEWIQKIYDEIGKDGIIEVEGSGTYETSYKVTDGVRFRDAGWISPYMATENNRAVYENPYILVTKRKIEKDPDITNLVELARKDNRALVIFTDDMDSGVATRLVATHQAKVAKILIIKAPILWKGMMFEDFAKCVGATIVEDRTGLTFKNLKVEHLGSCEKLITDAEDTVLMGIKDISDHKKELKEKGDNDSLLRLQWLNTKSAVLKMGAGSESELSYKLLKARDALNACRLSFLEGIIVGAGKGLSQSAHELGKGLTETILYKALYAPLLQLCDNNGGDIIELEGVYDAKIVISNAIKNAVSLAGIVATIQGDIRLKDRTKEDIELEILSKKQNPF